MRLAKIEDGLVVNVVKVDPDNIPDFCTDWPEITEGGKGWTYDGKAFASPVVDLSAWRSTAELPKAEFCVGLIGLGILTSEDAVSASRGSWPTVLERFLTYLTPEQSAQLQIEWATRVNIRRTNTFVLLLASYLNLTDATVDTLFGWEG